MKKSCIGLLLSVLTVAPAFAAGIVVDGDISDWPATARQKGLIINNAGGSFQIAQYGAMVQGGTLYGFVEVQNPMGVPGGTPDGNVYPGIYIDVDNSTATTVGNVSGFVPAGVDINVEVDYDTGAIPAGGGPAGHAVNLWGTATPAYPAGDWAGGSAASSGIDMHNPGQTIFEWSIPVSEVIAAVADGAVGAPENWRMYVGGEGGPNGGRTVGKVIPHPGRTCVFMVQ